MHTHTYLHATQSTMIIECDYNYYNHASTTGKIPASWLKYVATVTAYINFVSYNMTIEI